MKKLKNPLVFGAVFLLTCSISSCNSDDDSKSVSGSQNATEIINTVRSGSWKITYYYDTNHEETTDFNGYNFTFGTGNVLTASNGTNTYSGTWSVTDDGSDDNNSNNDLDFNIAFSSPEKFQELTDDWDIIEHSATVIKLRDVSGGNGGTDILTFTKN